MLSLYRAFLILSLLLSLVLALPSNLQTLRLLNDVPVLHITIARRGGTFRSLISNTELVNLAYLAEELRRVEVRFNLTRREVQGNKLVRKAKFEGFGGNEVDQLMGKVVADGTWYANISIGEPPQMIEVDLNMLTWDFYVLTTTSSMGSKYDDIFSNTYKTSDSHPFPQCSLPTDLFHLPTLQTTVPLIFAHCRPSKSSSKTLGSSGGVLGLAPSSQLTQIGSPNPLEQLHEKNIIVRSIFSLMLINGFEGVLSVGGTAERAVEMVIERTTRQLDKVAFIGSESGQNEEAMLKRDMHTKTPLGAGYQSDFLDWSNGWQWSKVQGAEGWWQILLQGIWVDGVKTLKNQPAVIDINTPFILAPPSAAKTFYASVSGSLQLPAPYQNFHVFPCLNPPDIQFEFDGLQFPVLKGGKGADYFGMPGGRFSLGRLEEGSGYCVGAVVQTNMGIKRGENARDTGTTARQAGELAGNGMRDVWVIGEEFFKGVGGVFDFKEQKVGFRTY